MFDVRAVLAQKELQLERVRREIAALVRVIPLLEDRGTDTPAMLGMEAKRLSPIRKPAESPDRGMAELELYYPFVAQKLGHH